MSVRIKKEIMILLREKFGTKEKPVSIQAIHQRINNQMEKWLEWGILAEKDIAAYAYARLNNIKIMKFLSEEEWTKVQKLIKEVKKEEKEFTSSEISKPAIIPKTKSKRAAKTIHPKKKMIKYLSIREDNLPDDFYSQLLNDINKAYNYEIYTAVLILTRKFLENLIIDILRHKYKMIHIDLFYFEDKGHHHSFTILIQNFETKLNDFKPCIPNLDKEFIKKIERFKIQANAGAHSIVMDLKKKDLDRNSSDFIYVINVLLKLYAYVKP